MTLMTDMHCHLYAGLDDGPQTNEDALAMCRILTEEGVTDVVAVAHQNPRWPANSAENILAAAQRLQEQLNREGIDLSIHPTGEVMLYPDVFDRLEKKDFLTVGNKSNYILIELPHNVYIDLRPVVQRFCENQVRPILAHAERCPHLLYNKSIVRELIALGCVIQVNAGSVSSPQNKREAKALKEWFQCGLVHVMGSDGHDPTDREPRMASARETITAWTNAEMTEAVFNTNGKAILQDVEWEPPRPVSLLRRWLPF